MSIRKRNKIYHYSFTITHEGRSERFRGSTGTDKKALAEEFEREQYKKEYEKLKLGKKQAITLDEALGRYWLEYAQFLTSGKNMVKGQLKNILRTYGKGIMLHEITNNHLQQGVNKRRQEKLKVYLGNNKWKEIEKFPSPRTINGELVTFNKMNNMAKNVWGVRAAEVSVNPFKLKLIKKMPFSLSTEQVHKLLEVSSPRIREVILFLLNTTVRLQNCIGLQGGNINMAQRVLTFRVKGGAIHTVPMTKWVFDFLKKKEPFGYNDYIFVYRKAKNKKPQPVKSIKKAIIRSFIKAGIDRPAGRLTRLFRETGATWILEAGEDMKTVQLILGHSRITTTEIYVGAARKDLASAIEKIGAQIGHKPKLRAV